MIRILRAVVLLLLAAGPAFSQVAAAPALPLAPPVTVVVAPTMLTFSYPDADMAITGSFRLETFLCNALASGLCASRALTPTGAPEVIQKAAIAGTASARVVNLQTSSFLAALAALPVGVPFVFTVVALGDGNPGSFIETARSDVSNPFYGAVRIPVPPTGLLVK